MMPDNTPDMEDFFRERVANHLFMVQQYPFDVASRAMDAVTASRSPQEVATWLGIPKSNAVQALLVAQGEWMEKLSRKLETGAA
jgi:hypothetical protein